MKTVWRTADLRTVPYVPRCSSCGGFRETLKEHWFFTGLYCVPCVRYKLYDDVDVPIGGLKNDC